MYDEDDEEADEDMRFDGEMSINELGVSKFYLLSHQIIKNEGKMAKNNKGGVGSNQSSSSSSSRDNLNSSSKISEYLVIKTNRIGKRQRRLMGIDEMYIYNKKPGMSKGTG